MKYAWGLALVLLISSCGASGSDTPDGAMPGDGGSPADAAAFDAAPPDATPTCETTVCDENATCVETVEGPACNCNPGWEGDGDTCTDVDECAVPGVCDPNATCTNDPGGYTCMCEGGWEGDGVTCTDVDECFIPDLCDPNALCENTPGSWTCTCDDGFTGDGTVCTDINECLMPDLCDENATCTNSPGSFACTCNPGYSGDGFTCVVSTGWMGGFPSPGDLHITAATNMWNAGDHVQGTRATGLGSASSLSAHVVITPNGLTCDTQDMKVMLNGTQVGTFIINPGVSFVDVSLAFPAVPSTAGSFTIRYETITTVAGGCGSADIPLTGGSTLELE